MGEAFGVIRIAKNAVHRMLSVIGLDLRFKKSLAAARVREKQAVESEKWRPLRRFEFSTVLDIGANEGQFAAEMRRLFPKATVVSFEPLPDVFEKLVANFASDLMVVPVNIGLGDSAGELRMNRSEFSPCSSLLQMAGSHKQEWPHSASHISVEVQVKRLDDWATESGIDFGSELLVKMDVQGFELAVIRGGPELLRQARMVVAEVSFEELYEGQPLFSDVHAELESLGFRFVGLIEQHCSRKTNRVLYADAIFENTQLEGR